MESAITAVRKALNLLSVGKIEGVADLLRAGQGFSVEECKELADYFDQTLSPSAANEFKLSLKQRRPGPAAAAPGVLEFKYFELGGYVQQQLMINKSKGQSENIDKAIGEVMDGWSDGNCPSQSALGDYYYFYLKTISLNPDMGPFIEDLIFPPHKHGKLKP